jgi:DNA adenine methylase
MNELTRLLFECSHSDEVTRESFIKAPFPWPGAKSKSVENILPHMPYRNGYAEPFGGSGSVLLSRRPCNLEVFNDRFSGVTSFYRVIRDKAKLDLLIDRLQLCLHSREEFIWCKNTWKNCEDDVERAARWWYMVTCSFGALSRNFGRAVSGKVQQGPKLKTNLALFTPCHTRLQNVQIENQDWRQVLKDFDRKDMVWYIDPPYYKTTKGMYECELSDKDHYDLLEAIQHLDGFVALSGYENTLYSGYKWTKKLTWKNFVTQQSQAKTETNNLLEIDMTRGYAMETLWILERS